MGRKTREGKKELERQEKGKVGGAWSIHQCQPRRKILKWERGKCESKFWLLLQGVGAFSPV